MLRLIITNKGIGVNEYELNKFIGTENTQLLLTKLIYSKTRTINNKQYTKQYYMFKRHNEYLIFSRFSLSILVHYLKNRTINQDKKWTFVNKIPKGNSIDADMAPGIQLDDNQKLISQAISAQYTEKNIKIGQAGCVLVLGTGLGKTFIGCSKIADLMVKTLIIVPGEIVLKEWKQTLTNHYPNIQIGIYTGKHKCDGDVVLMISNSATSNTFKIGGVVYDSTEYFSQFGFVIYDEIHNYTSEKRQILLWRTGIRYSLGLTATPNDDIWQSGIVFERHVGPLLIAKDIYGYNPKQIIWTGNIFPVKYYGPPEYTKIIRNPGNQWTSHCKMTKQFCDDKWRTELVINIIISMYNMNRNVFVFFTIRDYAITLSSILKDRLGVTDTGNSNVSILMGGAVDGDYENAKESKIVLTTYGFGWQGLSIPRMDTIIFATPRVAKMTQIIGRILRSGGDPSIPRIVYDIVDANTNIGKSEYRERLRILTNNDLYQFSVQPSQKWKVLNGTLTMI